LECRPGPNANPALRGRRSRCLPVLRLHTADRLGIIAARRDYQEEVGWHQLARQVRVLAHSADVVHTLNYGDNRSLTQPWPQILRES
jgi:hypothetical protein